MKMKNANKIEQLR